MSKDKEGDIVYILSVCNELSVTVDKVIIESVYGEVDNVRYSYIVLDSTYDFSNFTGEKEVESKTSSGVYSGPIYYKDELDDAIKLEISNVKRQIEESKVRADNFRCPLTGGKLVRLEDFSRYYTKFSVEDSSVIWKTGRKHGVYHTEYLGEKRVFEYLGKGKWVELEVITCFSQSIYVDKNKYISNDPVVLEEIRVFKEKREKENCESLKRRIVYGDRDIVSQTAIKIKAKTMASELISIMPMSKPMSIYTDIQYISTPKVRCSISGHEIEVDGYIFDHWVKRNMLIGSVKVELIEDMRNSN